MLSERIQWLWQNSSGWVFFKGIMDLTLHDVMDHIAGGAYGKIDKNRLYAYLSKDLPAVIAPGGLDTIAFPMVTHPFPS